jgi:hypothetical protein
MSSTTLQKLSNPDAAGSMVAVIEAVAERAFFTVVDRCPEKVLTALAAKVPHWITATVRFEDGPLVGTVSCTLPEDLAHSLFDSFSGRDPAEPVPSERQLYDLVGEFANMVCGSWLSRCATERAFRLGSPLVARVTDPATVMPGRLWIGVGNRPAAIDVCLHAASYGALAEAGA